MAKTSATHLTVPSKEVSRPATALSSTNDFVIAGAVAEAVRALPMVLDLSAGIGELAATYGPRAHVTGVVIRHPRLRDITIDVHVILRGLLHDESRRDKAPGGSSHRTAEEGIACDAVLARAADEIRRAVYRAAKRLALARPTAVDVLIEDIQAPT
jgi:hypothetical protein